MRTQLWQKLFLAFAALSVTALLALYLLQQRAFQRDFLTYVNRLGMDRLEQASLRIGRRYEEVGNWGFVIRQPRVFDSLINGGDTLPSRGPLDERDAEFRGRTLAPGEGREPRPPRLEDGRPPPPRLEGGRPPPPDGADDFPPPPPPRREDQSDSTPPVRAADERPPIETAPPRRKVDALMFPTRVALTTAEGQWVIGNPAVPSDSPFVAVKSHGEIVGKLLLAPLPELQNEVDLAFARSQTRHTLIAAAGVLAGALLFAWILARWLLAPIKALGRASQKLTAGDYSVRIADARTDELGVLAHDFNRLAEALERNQQARRDWGADIAHELRTPLSILRGEIQALQDGVRPVNAGALASLQGECSRLTALVEDLYQLALSDAGALEYRFVTLDLGNLLSAIVNDHSRALAGSGIALTLEPPPRMMVRADELRLTQLFGNLLINSQRYTDAPGRVVIQFTTLPGMWQIHVDDSPPGVSRELLPKLFDRLFRVETSRNRAAGGAGLGLAICRNIATAHGGKIEAGTSPLGGLRITVTLPREGKA